MLRLHEIFFRSFIIVFTICIIISAVVSFYTIRNIKISEIEEQLKNNIIIFENSVKSLNHIQDTINNINKTSKIRITLVDTKGIVIAETNFDKDEMDNHINRDEILESNKDEFGMSVRFSDTLKKSHLYVAKKSNIDNKTIYIRMSYTVDKVFENFNALWLSLLLIFMISILIALALAYRLNKKIETEISAISDYLENIESKNYSSRLETTFAKEFVIISYLIKKLAKRLDKRAKQKRKQTAKLKLLNKQKDEIISAISHEFKNPIAVIVGYCETLTNDKDINEKMRDRFLSKISVNATKLSNMINRLRLAVSLEDKEYKPSFSNMNIYNITNNAITLLKEAYKDRDVLLHGSDTTVNVDPVLMDIAITNIIENALKYSEDIVEVYIEDNSITIKDYGFGISQDDIDKITDKFYRVDKNIWNNSLGLGLSIVNRILKIHNFTLAITSQEDIGSEFKITFND